MTKPDQADEAEKAAVLRIVDVVDGPPIDADSVLSDEQLGAGGLLPVRAWMRTKPSANALRQHRKREKAEDAGLRQLNVVLPADEPTREAVKALAERLTGGSLSLDDVRALVQVGAAPGAALGAVQAPSEASRVGERVLALTGWRRAVVLWLLS